MAKIKIVYNQMPDGVFGLSQTGLQLFQMLEPGIDPTTVARHNLDLIATVETLGAVANGDNADLVLFDINEGEPYKIELNPDNSEKVTTIQDFGWISTFS